MSATDSDWYSADLQEEPQDDHESSSTQQELIDTQVEPADMQVEPSDTQEEEMPTVSTPNQAAETQFSYMAPLPGISPVPSAAKKPTLSEAVAARDREGRRRPQERAPSMTAPGKKKSVYASTYPIISIWQGRPSQKDSSSCKKSSN